MKVVCVGRNYREHARELENQVPREPVLFMKPDSSVTTLGPEIVIPRGRGRVHHEVELAARIGPSLGVDACAVALDLTLRDLQTRLKREGLPWERAKAFAGSCPLSPFVPREALDLRDLRLRLTVNGAVRQEGRTSEMIWPVETLVETIHEAVGLREGDVILTGTPAGVGPLEIGDELDAEIEGIGSFHARII